MLRRPDTIEDFLAPPSQRQWLEALREAWDGPDGSSSSTDTICGVRIGIMSASHRHAALPANRHDWLYFLGRHFSLPATWRQRADALYRDECIRLLNQHLDGFVFLSLGKLIAHGRYFALRLFGSKAWRYGSGQRRR
jgi:hypothetical protein